MTKRRPALPPELQNEALRIAEDVVKKDFEDIRRAFLQAHNADIVRGLESVFQCVELHQAPLSESVKERFMHEHIEHPYCELRPAFHGTNHANHNSIFRRGLLIPGDGNELKIAHGAAHGRGVYTANIDAAWLSRGFCTAPVMLVCGVLQTEFVRHIFDAMVVGKSEHVIPLFIGLKCDLKRDQHMSYLPRLATPTMGKGNQASTASNQPKITTNLPKDAAQEKKVQKTSKFKAQLARKANRH